MYKAIEEIGGYKIGEEVPADKAETWLKMYVKSPVEKIDGESEESEPEEKEESVPEEKPSENVMLDDYLSRNTSVVKKNIEEDDLSQGQLEGLLKLEKSNKKRGQVMDAIEKKLKKLGV